MTVAAPIARKTLEDALADWFADATGIDVIWRNQNAPAPAYPYGTLQIMTLTAVGTAEERQGDAEDPEEGEEIEISTAQPQKLVLSVNTYACTNDSDADARAQMDKALGGLKLAEFREPLREAGLAFIREGAVQSLDFVESDAWVSRAQCDVTFTVISNVVEHTTFIETVEAELTIDDRDPVPLEFSVIQGEA